MPPQIEQAYVAFKDRLGQAKGLRDEAMGQIANPAAQYVPKARRLQENLKGMGGKILDFLSTHVEAKSMPASPAAAPPPAPPTPSPFDTKEFAPIVFGEVSNRPAEKQELEARVILTTALNRMKAHKERGREKSLDDILTEPNQYQAYKGEQYNIHRTGSSSASDAQKKQATDAIVAKLLEEVRGGTFKPLSERAYYYQHAPDGTIRYDDTRPLFK